MDKKSLLSEICGLHAGDGYLRNKGYRVELDLSGNNQEKEFYDKHVIPLFYKVFKLKILGRYFPHRNTYGFVIRKRYVIRYMHMLGFPYGKKTLIVRAPKFVFNSVIYMKRFLRGYFDTDGCLSYDKKHKVLHYYPRIIFSTCSKGLYSDVCKMLQFIGIRFWTRSRTRHKQSEHMIHEIWIRGKPEVNKWFSLIGSKNNIQTSRYLIWKKYGFCPPHLTYDQAKQILKGYKDPIKFYKGP